MNILKLFKTTDDGQYIVHLERLWLIENDNDNDGYTPRPVPNEYFKFVFIGKIKEYLATDYNITKYVDENLQLDAFRNKYKFAIQMIYPYLGTDDNKLGKNVISLYLVKNNDELFHYQRIWEEL